MDGLPRITLLAFVLLAGCDERQLIKGGDCDGLLLGTVHRHESTGELIRLVKPVRGDPNSLWVQQRGFNENVLVSCALISPFTEDGKSL